MKKSILSICALFLVSVVGLQGAVPVVSNISASQRAGTKLVDIYYNVSASTSTVTVAVQISEAVKKFGNVAREPKTLAGKAPASEHPRSGL